MSEEAARGGTSPSRLGNALRRPSRDLAKPLSLSYAVEPSGLRRTARLGSETLADDRCTRDVQTASGRVLDANAPAAAVHAVQPVEHAGKAPSRCTSCSTTAAASSARTSCRRRRPS